MKRTTLFLLIASVIIYSCTDSKSASSTIKNSKTDSTTVVGLFQFGAQGKLVTDYLLRVTKDTFTTVIVDSTSEQQVSEKKWIKDTTYFAPWVDTTWINPATNTIVFPKIPGSIMAKDTLGRPILRMYLIPLPANQVLQEYAIKSPIKTKQ